MAKGVKSELKILSKHSSIYGLANILNRIVAFVLLPFYTHYLTPQDYGVMDLIYFTTTFLGFVIGAGINLAIVRFYFDAEEQSERYLAVSTAFYGFGASSLIATVVLVSMSSLVNGLLFPDNDYTNLVIIGLVGLGVDIYVQVGFTYLRIRQRSLKLMIISLSRLFLQLSLNIIFIAGFGMGVLGILLATLIVNSMLALYLVPDILRETGIKFSKEKLKAMFKYGLPMIPSDILTYIVNVSDRYFVNHFVGLTQTGLYTLGYRFGVLINTFVAAPFAQIWVPRRFEMFQKDESGRIFGRIFTYFCLIMCLGGVWISLVTKDIIVLMTEKSYWSASAVVPVIVLSYIIARFELHFNLSILIKKKTTYMLWINLSSAAVNLALNYFLIRAYGIWGAAFATLATFSFKAMLMYYISNRLIPIVTENGRLVTLFALGGVVYWLLTYIETGYPGVNVILKSLGCLAYPGALLLLRFFEEDELNEARQLIKEILVKIKKIIRRDRSDEASAPEDQANSPE